jgi:excisionase family DNA binding protein
MPNSPRFLKVAELAELLKVKPRTIYEMVAQNRIPYRKPPGTNILRFDLDEILAWTKARHKQMKLVLIRTHRVVYCRHPWLHLGKGQ